MRYRPTLIAIAVLSVLLGACGRKAPPVWLEPIELPAVSDLKALYKDGKVSLTWNFPDEMMPYTEGFRVEKLRGGSLIKSVITRDRHFLAKDDELSSYRVSVFAKRKGVRGGVSPLLGPPSVEAMRAPEELRAEMTAEGLMLRWDRVKGADAYDLYRWVKGGSAPDEPLGMNLEATGHIDDFAIEDEGDVIMYSVTALSVSRMEGAVSVASGPASAPLEINAEMFRPSAPARVDITQSGEKVLVYWDVSPEKWVEGYRVYKVDREGETNKVADTVTPAYSEKVPDQAGIGYAVSAYGRSLESPLSSTVWVKAPSSR